MPTGKEKLENKDWYFYDAKDLILGRLSTGIANHLRGKAKVSFRNNIDCGDYVVVINAEKIVLTGAKEEQKRYFHHTGYIGNLKEVSLKKLRQTKPEEIIKKSVYGMLPANKLRPIFMKRLKLYVGDKHPHVNIKFKNI